MKTDSMSLLVAAFVATITSRAAGQWVPPPPLPPQSDFDPPPPSLAPSAPWQDAPRAAPPPRATPDTSGDATKTEPPREAEFGDRGEFVVTGSLFINFGHLGYSNSDASSLSLSVQPSLDYFVAKNLLLGGAIYVAHANTVSGIGVETNSNTVGAYLHIGGNVPLASSLSWRPVASIGVWNQHSELSAPTLGAGFTSGIAGQATPIYPTGTKVNETVVVAEIFGPFLIHPARHFFFGFGPDFYTDLSHSVGTTENQRTFIGLSSIIGGWFGGGEPESI
jgi:hypothetical protein